MPVDPDCDDGDCGPEEPPDPEENCGPQGCQAPNVYRFVLTVDNNGCSVCGDVAECVSPDDPNFNITMFETHGECCDVANDGNEQREDCPSCVEQECNTTATFLDISSVEYPPGTPCSSISGWKTWNPTVYGCQWYAYLPCPPGCINEPFPDPLPPEYQEGGACCDPELGYTGCEAGVELPCLCPDGSTGLSVFKPVLSDTPCIEDNCNKSTATWLGTPVGDEISDGQYRLQWDLIDDCPGTCCTEPPSEPELGSVAVFVNTPCSCNCKESLGS